jgi:hypothetical protein
MESTTSTPSPTLKYDTRSVVAAALCLGALFLDGAGWLLAIVGVGLLPRAAFPARIKWMLAAVALVPKILFLGVRSLTAPQGLSFTIEPRTLATSSSLWAWSTLLIGFGVLVVLQARRAPAAPGAPVGPQPVESQRPLLLRVLGLAMAVGGVVMLLGLLDGFQRIDDGGDGRWTLHHAARGTLATFTRDDLSAVEVREQHSSRGSSHYSVLVTLTEGRTFSVSTTSREAVQQVRDFATTADVPRGRVRSVPYRGATWVNGASGSALKDFVGTYEHVDASTGERSSLEFWIESGRLAGKEHVFVGQRPYVRPLRNIRVSDTGSMEYEPSTLAEVGHPSAATTSFSWRWSAGGESGRLTSDGFEVGGKKYRRR